MRRGSVSDAEDCMDIECDLWGLPALPALDSGAGIIRRPILRMRIDFLYMISSSHDSLTHIRWQLLKMDKECRDRHDKPAIL